MAKHIANIITLSNLFMGCIALVLIFEARYIEVFVLIALCGLADFLDGFAARRFGSDGELGLHLDSLADLVSFGVIPGMIMYHFLSLSTDTPWLPYFAFLVTVFAGLRLGNFNLSEDTTGDFVGMATPAMTGFVAGLLLIFELNSEWGSNVLLNPTLLCIIVVILSVLMISNIPMISLKFKGKQWTGNEWRYVLIALFPVLLIFIQEWAFSGIILFYILMSITKHVLPSK